MKTDEMHSLKQVCFRLEIELSDKQSELKEAMKVFLPKGSVVSVKDGRGIHIVKVVAYNSNGYFVAESRTGKNHNYYYKNVV